MGIIPIPLIIWLIEDLLYLIIFPGLVTILVIVIVIIWLERKIAAKVQMRFGPLWVSKKIGGALQSLADLLRYSFQEVIIPEKADKLAFILAPGLMFAFATIALIFIPVGPYYSALFPSYYTILFSLALIIITPIFAITVGWASDNKFSFIGALREGFLLISYEVPFLLSVVSMIIIFHTYDYISAVQSQLSFLPGIILNPIAALTMLIVMIRTTGRFPFDITEADSELVLGLYTEYSALFFGVGMATPYVELYNFSLIFSLLFLGGWWPFTLNVMNPIYGLILPGIIVVIKAFIVMAILVFLRAVYPRYRLDQAVRSGWSYVLLLSIVSVILSVGEVVFLR